MRDNHGFGLLAMLGFCCFLGVCILISYFSWMDLTGNKKSKRSDSAGQVEGSGNKMESTYRDVDMVYISNTQYHELEQALKRGAQAYVSAHDSIGSNSIILTVRTLQNEGNIKPLVDSYGSNCHGYVLYFPARNSYVPYLRCNRYMTSSYNYTME